ncbi:MAG: ATP-binding protein [Megasphaera sp.]|jgi:two-component system phosphate regulon sensor histidine kinase PhoR|nr:ATP-binding protein [Megasphaera sp.]
MKKKIYLSLLAMGFVCMAVSVILSSWLYWRSMQREAADEMNRSMVLISSAIMSSAHPENYLQHIATVQQGQIRVTWIQPDGTVHFESDYNKGEMENHLQRPEVQQALQDGNGTDVRNSRTLAKEYYYTAERLPDGSVLRLGMERNTIFAHIQYVLPIIFLFVLVASLGCIRASRRLTDSLLRPLQTTATLMERIGAPGEPAMEKLDHVEKELRPLVDKIVDQSNVLNKTIHTLSQQRNMVRLMMENLQEGVILTNQDYDVLVVNQCSVTMLCQKDKNVLIGKHLPDLFPKAPWQKIHCGGEEDEIYTWKVTLHDNQYQINVQCVENSAGFNGYLFIMEDITEQERREQLRREFTSNVSHELKTPLTSISGFAEVLSAKLYQNDEDVVHFATLIRKESKRLLMMIEEIMHLTRIEEGRRQFVIEPVCLKQIVDDIVGFMEPVWIEKKVTVHCQMDDTCFEGDKVLIRELAMNLIDNAVKYNRPGGHVYIKVLPVKEYMEFSVRDTGIGIPDDKQKRVFERFYRADSSRSQKINGTGLGLSIVKHIVEQHQGTIHLHSIEGEGTEITVRIPLVCQK